MDIKRDIKISETSERERERLRERDRKRGVAERRRAVSTLNPTQIIIDLKPYD